MRSPGSAISNFDSAWLIAALSAIAILAIVAVMLVRARRLNQRRMSDSADRETERQNLMLNALPAAVVVLDKGGKVHLFNDAWLKLVREPAFSMPDGGKGEHYRQVLRRLARIPESDPETTLEAGIRRVAKSRDHRFDEEFLTVREGNWPWFHVYVRTMDDEDSSNVLLMLVNISARKRQEFNLDTTWEGLYEEEIGPLDGRKPATGNALHRLAATSLSGFYRALVRYNPRAEVVSGALRTIPAKTHPI